MAQGEMGDAPTAFKPSVELAVSSRDKQLQIRHAGNNRSSGRVSDERQTVSYFDFRSFLREYASFHAKPLLADSATRDSRERQLNETLTNCDSGLFSTPFEPHIAFAGGVRRAAVCPSTGTAARFLLAGA